MNSGASLVGKIFCVIISVLCIGFLAFMNISDKTRQQQKVEEVQAINEDTRETEKEIAQAQAEEKAAVLAEKAQNDSFYQKLSDRFDVNILVLGDTNAHGYGASSDTATWVALLKESIEKTYNVTANVDNLATLDSGSYAAYASAMQLDEAKDYDFAIICTGAVDPEDTMPVYYEATLRAIQKKFGRCSILTVQEYMEDGNNVKNSAILTLSNTYKARTVDIHSIFSNDPTPYIMEGGYLNDEGHRMFAGTIFASIQEAVEADTGYAAGPEQTVYTETEKFDNFLYVPAENFTRKDKQYAMDTSFKGIVGFDFNVLPGDNKIDVYVDRVKVSTVAVTNKIDATVPHIELVEGELTPNRRIGIIFESVEAADNFLGMYVTTTG